MSVNKKSIMVRYSLITLVMILAGVAIIVKACIIMFAERDYWQTVADRFKKENVIISPNRGNIISADGKLMASSLPEYKIYMDFKAGGKEKDDLLSEHMDEICKGLNKIFPDKSAAEFKRHLQAGRKKGSRNYLIYPKRISYIQFKEAKRLPVFNLNKYKGGFHEQAFTQRKKPFGSLAERTLGDVYADTTMGPKYGLELSFDSILKGRNGLTHRKKVKNKYLSFIDIPPVDGCDIVTTIDVGMQDIAEKALVDKLKEINADIGVAVLMEVATGEIKAIVNMTKCSDGVYRERMNNAVADMLEPGSTFKTASVMVALEDGKITLNDEVDTGNGQKKMGGRIMYDHNWRTGGYGRLDVKQIMMYSSNIGVSELIEKNYSKNPSKFVEGLYRMSLNEPLKLEIPGAGKPDIRHPKDKDIRGWSNTALPWMSIGYETRIPPINTLTFYNAIANNGKMIHPKFVKAIIKDGEVIEDFPAKVINPSICSKTTLEKVQGLLEAVVSEGLGKPAGSSQFKVAGKTGTALIAQNGGYRNSGTRYLVSFCGYFPADNPKYSCIVAIQKPGPAASGGLMAGAVFGKIAERVYAKDLTEDIKQAVDVNSVIIPDVKNGDLAEAKYVLDALKIKTQTAQSLAKSETPIWGNTQQTVNSVTLNQKEVLKDFVPNVVGMGAKDAVYLLESKGLKVNLKGVGKVHSQSIAQGTMVKKGQNISLQLRQ